MTERDFRDYFQILGLDRSANNDDVKQAFRKLAKKYHPDVNQGNKVYEAKFKEISEAYEVLSDPVKRKKYEQFGIYWNQRGENSSNGAGIDVDFGQYGNFEEFINDLLGRFAVNQGVSPFARNPYGSTGSLDAQTILKISFSEALHGTVRTLSVNDERVQIKIPKGIKSGSKLRVQGKGNIQPGTGRRGDLFIKLSVQEHPIWKLDGDLLCAELPISLDELVLGTIVTIITPEGEAQLKIPQGTLPGNNLRLKGKGFPINNHRGDLIFTITLKLPDQWSSKELDLFNQLRKLREDNPRKDWLKSIRF